jgi:hypothetical protein
MQRVPLHRVGGGGGGGGGSCSHSEPADDPSMGDSMGLHKAGLYNLHAVGS